MAKLKNISGFPEWSPQQKLLEDELISRVRSVYESHGFVPIETPSVELMSTLTSKGVVDKELYTLRRARAEDEKEAELGLHFDLTVPFARYVAQHFNDLVFPFRRYQLQRAWRGERPQKGRFREFYQFDIDIVARDTLPIACDAEIVTVLDKAISSLGIGEHVVKLNNRKLLLGIYNTLGLAEEARKKAITAIDKLQKIGEEAVLKELSQIDGVSSHTAEKILSYCKVVCSAEEALPRLQELDINDQLFRDGMTELSELLKLVSPTALRRIEFTLSLARGLDYYTGLIVEAHLPAYPDFGSVCGGGRYEDLVSQYMNKTIPGVGVSLGLTRLMDLILRNNLIEAEQSSVSKVLVAVHNEDQRASCNSVADQLRGYGVPTEVFFKSPKLGKQIEYADKKSIPYVLFIDPESEKYEMRDIRLGEQKEVHLQEWAQCL